MKKFLILCLCLGVGAFFWLLYSWPNSTRVVVPDPTGRAGESVAPATARKEKPPVGISIVSGALLGKYPRWEGGRSIGLNDPRWAVVRAREKIDPSWEGKMSLEFFGQVVDVEGIPVEGATVRFSRTDTSADGTTQSTARSDARGLFSLMGVTGKFLQVEVEKEGYYTSQRNPSGFEFAMFSDANFYQPDSGSPVVFRLRRKAPTDVLLHRQTLYGLKIDGTPQYLDLRTGKKSSGGDAQGDLALALVRKPSGTPGRYDWILTLSAVGAGGVLNSTEEFPFLAPAGSYERSIAIAQQWGDSGYEGQARRSYYVKLADGRTYARINTDIRPKYNDAGAIDLELFLNPSGSRNLEYDPAKVAK